MTHPKRNCKNCDQVFDGNYCSNCGQAAIGQFTFRYLWELVQQDLFDVDRGLLRTVKELTTRPGHMIRDYLSGKTKSYFSPLKYLLVCVALFYFLNSLVDGSDKVEVGNVSSEEMKEFVFNSHSAFSFETLTDALGLLLILSTQNLNLYFLLLLPVVAYVSKVSLKKLNYTELLITWSFLWGHVVAGNIIAMPLIGYLNEGLSMPLLVILMILMIYFFTVALTQLTGQLWFKSVLKVLISLYGGIFLFFGTTLVILIISKLIFIN